MLGQYNGGTALYHLDGGATDSSGNGNNGTATNVTRVGGKVGTGAASFNGSNSRILLPSSVKTGNSKTIIGWINPTGSDYDVLFSEDSKNYCGLWLDTTKLMLLIKTTTTSNAIYYSSLGDVPTGVWSRIAYVYNSITGYLDGYVNGVQVIHQSVGGDQTYGSDTNPYLGCYSNSAFFLAGLMDEVIIDTRPYTKEDMLKDYTMSKGRYGIL